MFCLATLLLVSAALNYSFISLLTLALQDCLFIVHYIMTPFRQIKLFTKYKV